MADSLSCGEAVRKTPIRVLTGKKVNLPDILGLL
jgi:hypothetical protein